MNFGELKTKTLKLIDRYSQKGTVLATPLTADYTNRIPDLANDAQIEVAKKKKLSAVKTIVNNTIMPAYKDFTLQKYIAGSSIYSGEVSGAVTYYFEVDGNGTVFIEDWNGAAWVTLSTITVVTTEMKAYTGSLSGKCRIKFAGGSNYNIRNVAIWTQAMTVTQFAPYLEYAMPTDFMELNEVIYNDVNGNRSSVAMEWANNKLLIPYDTKGVFDVHYYKYPTAITGATADNYTLENTVDAQECYPFYCAAQLIASENDDVYKKLMGEYELKLSRLETYEYGRREIINESGW